MHPAKSVILFTTASGAGYGLVVMAALFDALGLMAREPVVTAVTLGLALALIVVGLLASTFHLGHPERAWRALSQWRSSWLSREGVAALWTFLPILGWGTLRLLDAEGAPGPAEQALAVVAGLSALATLYCTGMIYASLKAVPMWATRWTPAAYLLIGPATGGVLFNAIAHLFAFHQESTGSIVTVVLLLALASKMGFWKRAEKMKPAATAESATGLGRDEDGEPAAVTLLEAPHSEPNYLMREMGFRIARKHAARLRRIAMVWTFLFPMLAIWMSSYSSGWAEAVLILISLVTAGVGLVAERYLFFAEARHVQSLYYGEAAV
mgnify:CR=1 FL=1